MDTKADLRETLRKRQQAAKLKSVDQEFGKRSKISFACYRADNIKPPLNDEISDFFIFLWGL